MFMEPLEYIMVHPNNGISWTEFFLNEDYMCVHVCILSRYILKTSLSEIKCGRIVLNHDSIYIEKIMLSVSMYTRVYK